MQLRFHILSLIVLSFYSLSAAAQGTYLVEVRNQTYADLTTPTTIPADLDPTLGYGIRVPFAMEGFGIPLDFDDDPQPVFVFTGGFIGVSISSMNRIFVIDAFVSTLGRRDETSSISYILEGEGEEQVLKLQWKNMKLLGNPEGDYLNVQVWLFRRDNSFEVHVGPNRVTGTAAYSTYAGPSIGAFLSNSDLSQYLATVHLAGNPASPSREIFNAFYPMEGTPADGTVYRFTYRASSAVAAERQEEGLRLHPNPSTDGFTLDLPEHWNVRDAVVEMYDLLGRQVVRLERFAAGGYVATEDLPEGLYHVVIYDGDRAVSTQRLMIAR